jgi:hypothetical protein
MFKEAYAVVSQMAEESFTAMCSFSKVSYITANINPTFSTNNHLHQHTILL